MQERVQRRRRIVEEEWIEPVDDGVLEGLDDEAVTEPDEDDDEDEV